MVVRETRQSRSGATQAVPIISQVVVGYIYLYDVCARCIAASLRRSHPTCCDVHHSEWQICWILRRRRAPASSNAPPQSVPIRPKFDISPYSQLGNEPTQGKQTRYSVYTCSDLCSHLKSAENPLSADNISSVLYFMYVAALFFFSPSAHLHKDGANLCGYTIACKRCLLC